MKPQANSEQVITIFFDKENVNDLTWKNGVLIDLSEAELEGRNFSFIQNILKLRSFKVKVN